MMATNVELRERVRRFKASLVPDLYLPAEFVPWESIEADLQQLKPAIARLQTFVLRHTDPVQDLFLALRDEPAIVSVLHRLFAAPTSIGFADGREFPSELPRNPDDIHSLAELLIDLGLLRVLTPSSTVEDLVRVASIAADARRRGFRRTSGIEERVQSLLRSAVSVAEEELGVPVVLLPSFRMPEPARGRVDAVVEAGGNPVAAISSVFQAQSGGNPQRVLSNNLPRLQQELDRVPLSLIVIADGRGLKETPDRILEVLLNSVARCMTLRQAEDGELANAVVEAAVSRGARPNISVPVEQIIESALASGRVVTAQDLPLERDTARLALASYARQRQNLDLELSPLGDTLTWSRQTLLQRLVRLRSRFDPAEAINVLSHLLDAISTRPTEENIDATSTSALLELRPDSVLPQRLLVVSTSEEPSSMLLRHTARFALNTAYDSRIAAVLAPEVRSRWDDSSLRHLQNTLPANVVLLDTSALIDLASAKARPRDGFVRHILEQADLTKASPFVLRSATPERMFYGRQVEEASLSAAVSTNSVAILGGRRIGKTSLMLHAQARLAEAGFHVLYGDCQTVRNWADFGYLAQRRWDAQVAEDFRPAHLFDLISDLHAASEGSLVLLLDEIDQLLDWDKSHTDEEVPEAFFRTCRTVSQEGLAQFVFSGERVIASKLWDPHSPHWNFCQPLPLQQLTRDSAEQLIVEPLASLQVEIKNREPFLDEVWRVTSGHPQILQFLGDQLVRKLNRRSPEARGSLDIADLEAVVETHRYREHYLETYWGQSTSLERLLSMLLGQGLHSTPEFTLACRRGGLLVTEAEVAQAMRMLDLYGIAQSHELGYALRAEWIPEALESYGGIDQAAIRQLEELR